ncbi:MAG: hypothetical protein K0U47_07105 [Epsilonproteobacteria bacterium]|nr:hypothetical protein [Campylobacterota bacterium]
MEINNKQYCNVCMIESNSDTKTVYIKAVCLGEEVHICTSCIPHVIHGSGEVVKTNSEVESNINS